MKVSAPQHPPQITVIFLLYNAEEMISSLIQSIQNQYHSHFLNQQDWLEVIFVDDCSKDQTASILKEKLKAIGLPPHYKAVIHSHNLGLSATLNETFQQVKTPFVLTCHCDVLFGSPTYVASMLKFLEQNPQAAAITGQPTVTPGKPLPLPEKINFVTNLMDIFPSSNITSLIPVGFAEGRCDAFRLSALKQVGFYDTMLRTAGEDQVLAARLREAGYQIYQAPLPYFLSVSNEQNTLHKLVKHQHLFGKSHPYILLKNHTAIQGVLGNQAGTNRNLRTLLRASQILSTIVYSLVIIGILVEIPFQIWGIALLILLIMKTGLFFRHLQKLSLNSKEILILFSFQPFLDISYTLGFIQGCWLLLRIHHFTEGKTIIK